MTRAQPAGGWSQPKSVLRPHPARAHIRYLTVEEIAAELHLSRMSIYRRIEEGDLPAVRIGRSVRVAEGAYELFLREHYTGRPLPVVDLESEDDLE